MREVIPKHEKGMSSFVGELRTQGMAIDVVRPLRKSLVVGVKLLLKRVKYWEGIGQSKSRRLIGRIVA